MQRDARPRVARRGLFRLGLALQDVQPLREVRPEYLHFKRPFWVIHGPKSGIHVPRRNGGFPVHLPPMPESDDTLSITHNID